MLVAVYSHRLTTIGPSGTLAVMSPKKDTMTKSATRPWKIMNARAAGKCYSNAQRHILESPACPVSPPALAIKAALLSKINISFPCTLPHSAVQR